MKKIAVYPGTFDPITFGHIDVIKKALKVFDKVVVAVSDGANKNYLFNPVERIEIIKKALKIVDTVIVAISETENKNYFFSPQERMDIVKKALFLDLKFNKKKIKIILFKSLTTDLCKKYKSNIILRGLRAASDFEYEFQLAGMNRKLNNNIETIFLMSDVENQIISSKFVKEIISLGGDVKKFTTKSTIKSLKQKYD